MAIILLSEALHILHSGQVCSLTYVSADRKRGTGGKLIHIPQCVIYSQEPTPLSVGVPTNRNEPQIPNPKSSIINHQSEIINQKSTNPNHYLNKTRNIYIPPTRTIQKLHIKLITAFNGKKVLL